MKELNNNPGENITNPDFSYNLNIEKLLKFFDYEVSEETLISWMEKISKKSKRVIECKFGLIGDSQPCSSFKKLNEALGITNSKKAFDAAIEELKEVKYFLLLADYKKLEKRLAINIGYLASAMELNRRNLDLLGEEILNYLKELSSKQQDIIYYRYGLTYGGERHTFKETAEYLGYCGAGNIREVERKIFRKLRHPSNLRRISIYHANEYRELERKRKEEEERKRAIEQDMKMHPEKYVDLYYLKEQNTFKFKIQNNYLFRKGYNYIWDVANSNPEEIAVAYDISLEDAEILYMVAKRFDYKKHFKIETIMKKSAKDLGFSQQALDVLRYENPSEIGNILKLTVTQIINLSPCTRNVKKEIIEKKEAYIKSFAYSWIIDDWYFTPQTLKKLKQVNILSLGDFLYPAEEQISHLKGLNAKTMEEINYMRAIFGQESL